MNSCRRSREIEFRCSRSPELDHKCDRFDGRQGWSAGTSDFFNTIDPELTFGQRALFGRLRSK
jgi:hypothetical protein